MNRNVADKWRAGNEESRGALMSGVERVEPEVSPTPAKPRNNGTQRHSHCVLVNCSIHLQRERKRKKIQWNLNNPWSWKQTLWILKDFKAIIEDWLCFKFIWTILYDVRETSNMLWMLMAQWAACDKWWNASECRLSLADCWGLFHYGYSLYFENLLNLAGINSLKALSLSALCSPQPLNLKTEQIEGVWGRLMWYWRAKKINIKVKHLKYKNPRCQR